MHVIYAVHGTEAIECQGKEHYAASEADILATLCPLPDPETFRMLQGVHRSGAHPEAVIPAPDAEPYTILQTSYRGSRLPEAMIPAPNGLFNAIQRAYSQHHHLRLRPEDIWFAILTQFSFYVNAHAEELRDKFVAHDGRKKLQLFYVGTNRKIFDFGIFAKDMNRLIEENILDAELRNWMMPNFTTSKRQDDIIASIIMMGTTKNYFIFECIFLCGIPEVTLLGEKEDYEQILHKIDKLSEYGEEPKQFAELLRPVLRRMIHTFEEPTSVEVDRFWQNIFFEIPRGSGSTPFSGWITAFCFWDDAGKCLYHPPQDQYCRYLVLDGVSYHILQRNMVPPGWVKVPVLIDDHGEKVDAEMLAGSIGINCLRAESAKGGSADLLNTMQPETAWWIIEKNKALQIVETLIDKNTKAAKDRETRQGHTVDARRMRPAGTNFAAEPALEREIRLTQLLRGEYSE